MMRNITLETIHNSRRVVEIRSHIGRSDIGSSPIERDSVPSDELVFATVIVIVLDCVDASTMLKLSNRRTLSTSGMTN